MRKKYSPEYYKKWRDKIKNYPEKYQIYLAKQRTYGAISRAKRTPEQKEKIRQYNLKHKRDNYEKNKKKMAEWRKKVKQKVFEHYGLFCACCGEAHFEFLAIDHINGGGNKHRKELKRMGVAFFSWLIQNNFPLGFRTLCHNCNQSLGFFNYCPHTI